MDLLYKAIKTFLGFSTSSKVVIPITPNTFADIIKQFDQPKKEKTPLQVFQDYYYKEKMANLEVEMLKMEPDRLYKGFQIWFNNEGKKFFDWVPCIVRPEIIYCSYGKN